MASNPLLTRLGSTIPYQSAKQQNDSRMEGEKGMGRGEEEGEGRRPNPAHTSTPFPFTRFHRMQPPPVLIIHPRSRSISPNAPPAQAAALSLFLSHCTVSQHATQSPCCPCPYQRKLPDQPQELARMGVTGSSDIVSLLPCFLLPHGN